MAETIGNYQTTTITTPVNGDALDASVVVGHFNTIRGNANSHDGDAGVHLQSSALASRPAAGVTGRKWLTSDGLRLYYDTGTAWSEAAYLPLVGGTVTGAVTLSAAGTALAVTNNATVGGTLAVTGAASAANATATNGVRLSGTSTAFGAAERHVSPISTDTLVLNVPTGGRVAVGVNGGLPTATQNFAVGGTMGVDGAVTLASTLAVTGAVTLGSTAAAAGFIRLPNNNTISWRNAANSADLTLGYDASNTLIVSGGAQVGGALAVLGAATFDGNVTLGNATSDTVTVTGTGLHRGLVRQTTTDTRVSAAASTTTLAWSSFTGFGVQHVLEYNITSGTTQTLTVPMPSAAEVEAMTGLATRGVASLFFKVTNTSGSTQGVEFPNTAGNWASQFLTNPGTNSVVMFELLFFRNSGGTVSGSIRPVAGIATGWLSTAGPGTTSFVS